MNVFISWTGSDREVKEKIVLGLKEELGSEEMIWDSDEECSSDFSAECIKAIRASQVFVIIVSDAAMSESSYVFNELCEARKCEMQGKLNIVVYKTTTSEYTDRFEMQLNHITDANHVARLMNHENGIQSVIKHVKHLLARRKNGNPEKPYDVYKPEIEGTKLGSTGYFVPNSRDNVFKAFDEGFEKSNVIFVTQMSGYGRKSAARKYVEMHAEEYDQRLVLHSFSGTLREFFTNGLVISNINENVFENLDENKTILKKAQLLQKLDQRTLLVVPNVNIGRRDDTLVFDSLSGLGCRVMFIVQNVPQRIRGLFPVIDVGRLEDRHLRELFFNYYTDVDEIEQEALEQPLNRFFDSIDGHTKSVEITASTLAGEFGIYPDDIPDILENIRPNSENELSERIFLLISEMFDVKKFEENENSILLLASLAAQIPLDERIFVKLLKECGIENNAAIKNLVECCWLERDRASRTISIEPLLASVCLSKIAWNDEFVKSCLLLFGEMLLNDCVSYNLITSIVTVKRLHHIFDVMKMPALCDLMNLYVLAMDDVLIDRDRGYIRKTIDSAKQEERMIDSVDLKEAIAQIVHCVLNIVEGQLKMFDLSHRVGRKSFGDEAAKIMVMNEDFISSLGVCLETMEETRFKRIVKRLLNSAMRSDSGKFVAEYLQMVEELEECLLTEPTEEEIIVLELLEIIGQHMALITKTEPYLCLEISRAREKLLDYSGGFVSAAEVYIFYENYLACLLKMSECTNELDDVFSSCLWALENGKKDICKTEKDAELIKNKMICMYVRCLANNSRTEDAQEAYSMIEEVELCELSMVEERVETVDCVARALIRDGEILDTIDFLEKYLEELLQIVKRNAGILKREYDLALELKEILNILHSPKTDVEFADGADEYIDYYRTYASGFMDKRLLAKYAAVAEHAKKLDYSKKTREELLEEVFKLKRKAIREPKWEKLAPEAFAIVSEAGNRVLGYKHHYVQYMGGAAIADGKIAEILNGEGKTYTIILAAFLQSLYGKQVFIVDDSAYLTKRNFVWMRGVLEYIGCNVGLIADNKKAESELKTLQECEVIYAMINDLIFLQMRDEINHCRSELRYDLVIVDEADQLMIESADQIVVLTENEKNTNLAKVYELADLIVREITVDDTELFEKRNGSIILKPAIYERLTPYINGSYLSLSATTRRDLEKALEVAILVYLYYKNGKEYFIIGGKAKMENKDKGLLFDANPIYQFFIGKKENRPLIYRNVDFQSRRSVNQYTYMEFLDNFKEICGTTATASSMKEEFRKLYGIDVISIPPNQPITRIDNKPKVFMREKYKMNAVLGLIDEKYGSGQPIIVITGSIEESEKIGKLLTAQNIEHKLLNAKNSEDEPELLGSAGRLNSIIVTTAMANRGVDILLGGNPKELAKKHLLESGVSMEVLDQAIYGKLENSEEIQEIRLKYNSLVALYKSMTDVEKEQVEAVGGLCVIGTECFEDLRVEQQMRGRAGRQGAVGESYVFYSLDDEPLKKLLRERREVLVSMFDRDEAAMEMAMESKLLTKSIVNGRLRIQEVKFNYLQQTPEMLYYRNARNEIIGLIRRLRKGQVKIDRLVEEYFISNQRFIEKLSQAVTEQKPAPMIKLLSYAEGNISSLKGRVDSKMLTEAYKSVREKLDKMSGNGNFSEESMRQDICIWLSRYWSEYLKVMPLEIKSATNLFGNKEKKVEKYISEFSETQCKMFIEDAIFNTLVGSTNLVAAFERKQ